MSHAYSVPGNYSVGLTVTDDLGGTATSSLVLQVSASPAVVDTQPLANLRLSIDLNFAKVGHDTIALSGNLLLPAGFATIGKKMEVTIGGTTQTFVLGANGIAHSDGNVADVSSLVPAVRTGAHLARFAVKMRNGDFAAAMAAYGLTDATVKHQSVSVPISLTIGDSVFTGTRVDVYNAKAGRSGVAATNRF